MECLLQVGANPCIRLKDATIFQMVKRDGRNDLTMRFLQYIAFQLHKMLSSLADKMQKDLNSSIEEKKKNFQEILDRIQKHPMV